jgi:GAF domain-containing protein
MIVQVSQTISNETDMDKLIVKMVKAIAEAGNAQRGTFFEVGEDSNVMVSAECGYSERYL